MSRILVVGHSHVFPLRLALAQDAARAAEIDVCAIHAENLKPEITDGVLHPGLAARITGEDWDAVFLNVGGGPHVVLGISPHKEPFDFILPFAPDMPLQPNARILPYRLVYDIMKRRNEINLGVISEVNHLAKGRKFHFAYPPPLEEGHIRSHPGAFADAIAMRGINPLPLRRKLWMLNNLILRECCEDHGITVLDVPAAMMRPDGALVLYAALHDPAHGNIHYGRALLDQISFAMEAAA